MKIWFGKYKGTELAAVPLGYLEWAAANVTRYSDLSMDVLRREVVARGGTLPPPPGAVEPCEEDDGPGPVLLPFPGPRSSAFLASSGRGRAEERAGD